MKIKVEIGEVKELKQHIAVVEILGAKEAPRINHTLLVLDCSTSMTGYLDDVRDDSAKYVEKLSPDEFVSVVIFSGHGHAKLIAGPTQCTAEGRRFVREAINRQVKPISNTVFSEPLDLVLNTVMDRHGDDTAHSVVLFTDGCAVPSLWSFEEEQARALRVGSRLWEARAVVSAIGYGPHYDDKFLTALMTRSGNVGVYHHISEIDGFGEAINTIREVFTKTNLADVSLDFNPDFGRAGDVYRTTPQVFLAGSKGSVSTRGMFENQVTFYVLLSAPTKSIAIKGSIGNEAIDKSFKAAKLGDKNAADFLRVIAADSFLKGDRERAAELLALTADDGLAEKAASAFTGLERLETASVFRQVFRDRKFIGEGLKPRGPSHCVLNALRVLIEDQGNRVFIPPKGYKRSGLLTRDPNVIESPGGRNLQVVGYVSHSERLNFSLRCLKDIKVRLDNGRVADKKEFRTYNVILDGNLHLPELEATLTEDSFQELQRAGVIDKDLKYSATKYYKVDFRGLKMVSSNWASPATLGLVDLLREEKGLEAEQTALNARLKSLSRPLTEEGDDIYRGNYKVAEGVKVETYQASCCDIRLMKHKANSYDVSSLTAEQALARVREVRQRLVVVRFLSRSIIFAMQIIGSKSILWGQAKTNNYGKQEQLATFGGAQLKRVTWTEMVECS